jgi:hypothetical protein
LNTVLEFFTRAIKQEKEIYRIQIGRIWTILICQWYDPIV